MPVNPSSVSYRAHTNIALIKYWGKRNKELFLPMTSSLSITLDAFYTETRLSFRPDLQNDQFILNGQVQSSQETNKISRFIDLFRQESSHRDFVQIDSHNYVPTAAGLASSASAFAALGLCLNDLFQLHLDQKTLSTYVRQGSGSATRSLYGGFVIWHEGQGDDSQSSYSEPFAPADWDIHMLVVAVNKSAKKISSRIGMEQTVQTSPFYKLWPQEVAKDMAQMQDAIRNKNFDLLGRTAEHNAMKMHATSLAANPSFTYFQPDSLIAMDIVGQLRQEGIPCYFTMDAGPNLKILCQKASVPAICSAFLTHFQEDQLILASPGPDPIKLS